MRRVSGSVLAAVVVLAWGCARVILSDTTGSSGNGCTPGTQQACVCLGGATGVEECNAAGTAYGACQCSTSASSGTTTASSSTTTSAGTSSSTSSSSGAGGACAGHINYAAMYPQAPSIWAGLPAAGGLTSLDAGNAQCKALGADHVCDLTEVQAANAHKEPLFMAIPAGTTAWMQRTTPVYVEGMSGTPCTAAMAGQIDPNTSCSSTCNAAGAICETNSYCCSNSCVGGICAAGNSACVCAFSPPGPGGNCNDWTYATHHIGDGEYMVFGASGGVPTAPGLPANPGDPGFHYDNDTIFNPNMAFADDHHSADFGCGANMRAILCCYKSCM